MIDRANEIKLDAWVSLVRSQPRDLSRAELFSVLPARGPMGDVLNKIRGLRIRTLNKLGFTYKGERIS